MKVVILAGGFGTRIAEESQFKPKPMVESGHSHAGTHNEGARCLWLPCVHHLRRIQAAPDQGVCRKRAFYADLL